MTQQLNALNVHVCKIVITIYNIASVRPRDFKGHLHHVWSENGSLLLYGSTMVGQTGEVSFK